MKKLTFLLLLSMFIFTFQSLDAQTKNKPIVTIDVLGGYGIPLLDMGGTIEEMWALKGYGVSNAINTGFSVKYSVLTRKMFQLRIYSTFLYTQAWQASGEVYNIGGNTGNNEIISGWPMIGYKYPVKTDGESYMRLNIPSVGVGCEAAVYTDRLNKSSFNFGLDFDMSIITGRAYNTYYSSPEIFYTIDAATRVGFGINAVYNIKVANFLGINVGTRFQWFNLLGKSSKTSDSPWYIPLNDEAMLLPNYSSGNRNIATLNFFTGASFFIGKR